jgi:hypothetical protein
MAFHRKSHPPAAMPVAIAVILVTPAGNEHGFATSEPSALGALVLQNIEALGPGF